MRHASLASLLLLVLGCAEAPRPTPPVAEVAAAERAFSARAQVVNVRDAFVENFAPDAVLFAPDPQPAFPGLTEGPPWGVHIAWGPSAAGASCSGELGWTTGPADYRREAGGPVFRQGYYASIWTRREGGPWKVMVDLGTAIPPGLPREADWADAGGQRPCAAVAPDEAGYTRDLGRAAALLAGLTEDDAVAAFGARLHPAARLQRTGAAPAIGAEAVRRALAEHPRLRLTTVGVRAAASGDLGYSYGRGAWLDADAERGFVYLMVWERVDADWALRLIVQDAIPPKGAP